MKKFLGIIVLGLFFCINVFADVYYCIDIDANGFRSTDGGKKYEPAAYNTKKFKAKIVFDSATINATDINFDEITKCKKISSQKFSMTCTSEWGDIFTIEGDKGSIENFRYNRAITYGRGDSLILFYGNCEKF